MVLQAIKVRREGARTTFDQQVKACFRCFELVAAVFQSHDLGQDLLLQISVVLQVEFRGGCNNVGPARQFTYQDSTLIADLIG